MPTINQTVQIQIAAGQMQSGLDIPTRFARAMRLQRLSITATNAVTNVIHADITTVLESNGFIARPVDNEKPDIVIVPGATLRIICSRAMTSTDAVRALVAIELSESS